LITCSGWPVKRAQHRVLRGDADRAGVEVALAHHDAAGRDQRRGGEAELVGAQQRGDDHVAVGGRRRPAQMRERRVEQQRLLGFGQADFPRRPGVLQRGQRRSAGAAVVARDRHVVGARLGNAGGHRAHAHFGHQLDRDRARVGVLEVVDQLRQIFDRVDVVVRRRRDQADARRRVTRLADGLVDLVAGQLAAFAGLGALGHLDLDVVGIDQVFGRHAEAARGDLLDRRTHRSPLASGEARRILAAFAGVRLAADAVHRDGQRGVRLRLIEP
jgi:hypothetical protein